MANLTETESELTILIKLLIKKMNQINTKMDGTRIEIKEEI